MKGSKAGIRTRLGAIFVASFALIFFCEGLAQATTRVFAEYLTSSASTGGLSDVSATADVDFGDDLDNILLDASNVQSGGLGTGEIASWGHFRYSHDFEPVSNVDSIVSAVLQVEVENAVTRLSSVMLLVVDRSLLGFGLVGGAQLFAQDVATIFRDSPNGSILVDIYALGGALVLKSSYLEVTYDTSAGSASGTTVSAAPEPAAALLYFAGALVVARSVRKRSERSKLFS